ncbi:glycohydrolase toxin TNT-related protein, partial [Gilliamella sp. B3825]|nr:glycohydrolase toxin TNT-related protein [Gilliamella sp. B3812]MCX8606190.1 glycohydrolase toxin TNT-related protein [Gilliamella sp. B3825]
ENNKNLGGMGSDVSKGIDSAISIVTGIITGNITGGLAGASAPWVAEQIKKHTGHKEENGNWQTDDIAGNLIAHAILGAVVAELQGNSGLAGGAGAVTGELAADIIRKQLYGKEVKDLTEAEKQNISALAQLATGLAIASVGGDVGDVSTGIAAGKNSVENNGISWGDGGNEMPVPVYNSTGGNMDSIMHGYANGYLTQEETMQALSDLMKGKGMPNGSDYAELWMRAPEQIGQYLPGPIGTAMAILAATDIAITDTDKTNLVQLLNEASKDYLSDSSNAESMTALNKMIDRLGTGSTNTHLQSIIKGNVESNVAKNQKGNESSNFGEHSKLEGKVQEDLGIWPPNNGAYGPVEKVTLKPGTTVDRYGSSAGFYISPEGVAFEARALPSTSLNSPYKVYEIIKPIEDVSQSKVLP